MTERLEEAKYSQILVAHVIEFQTSILSRMNLIYSLHLMGKLLISINDGKTEQAVNASKETILALPFKCCTIKAQKPGFSDPVSVSHQF